MPTTRNSWIHRHTSANDLLDDGIENFSDLRGQYQNNESSPPVDPAVAQVRDATLARIKTEQTDALQIAYRQSRSYFGLFLAVLMMAGGLAAVLYPVDMFVVHGGGPKSRAFLEHITPFRAQLYGGSLFLIGAVLGYYSLYRPRGLKVGSGGA